MQSHDKACHFLSRIEWWVGFSTAYNGAQTSPGCGMWMPLNAILHSQLRLRVPDDTELWGVMHSTGTGGDGWRDQLWCSGFTSFLSFNHSSPKKGYIKKKQSWALELQLTYTYFHFSGTISWAPSLVSKTSPWVLLDGRSWLANWDDLTPSDVHEISLISAPRWAENVHIWSSLYTLKKMVNMQVILH